VRAGTGAFRVPARPSCVRARAAGVRARAAGVRARPTSVRARPTCARGPAPACVRPACRPSAAGRRASGGTGALLAPVGARQARRGVSRFWG